MATTGNNYGPGGISSDEFGALPDKRIENMHGMECTPHAPISCSDLQLMVKDYYKREGEIPKRLIYPGTRSNLTSMGVIMDKFGYVDIIFKNEPLATRMILE